MRMRVSLCMIARNEAHSLPTCVASVADLVDEIIVVDTGSADDTREVAGQMGAKVHDFDWIDDFAAARNESLRHATGDWILWLPGGHRTKGSRSQEQAVGVDELFTIHFGAPAQERAVGPVEIPSRSAQGGSGRMMQSGQRFQVGGFIPVVGIEVR